jgi:hypothetical protein
MGVPRGLPRLGRGLPSRTDALVARPRVPLSGVSPSGVLSGATLPARFHRPENISISSDFAMSRYCLGMGSVCWDPFLTESGPALLVAAGAVAQGGTAP